MEIRGLENYLEFILGMVISIAGFWIVAPVVVDSTIAVGTLMLAIGSIVAYSGFCHFMDLPVVGEQK